MTEQENCLVIPQPYIACLEVTGSCISFLSKIHMDFRIDNMNVSRHAIFHNGTCHGTRAIYASIFV